MLGVSTLTLRNWDKNGKLRALRHPMNNYRVYKATDIDNLIDSMGSAPIPGARNSAVQSRIRKLNVQHLGN